MPETYIPASRQELVGRLCASDRFSAEQQTQFHQFCEILSAYAHFTGQKDLELMKLAFSDFDPNADRESNAGADCSARAENAEVFAAAFDRTLRRANFRLLPESKIRAALNEASIVPVRTAVDFDDFERFAFYFRRSNEVEIAYKKWFRRRTRRVGNYDRMAVLMQIRDESYFDGVRRKPEAQMLPGKIYLSLYKNIPHHDLELLFPNLKISMTVRDKLMLTVPAVGAAVPLALKILPSLGLLAGAVALFVFGYEMGGRYAVEDDDGKALFALMTAVLSITLALGGFAAGQYVKYKSRRLTFLKKVTDVLFFKSLDVGKGVLNALVDAAEEEQCKEMILVFYLLLINEQPMDVAAVDRAAEDYLRHAFDCEVDFDVAKALQNLASITSEEHGALPIVRLEADGGYQAATIEEAKTLIDRVWDNAFRF